MSPPALLVRAVLVATIGLGACVETYDDTRVEANLTVGVGLDRNFVVLPTPGRRPGDAGYFSHYELFVNIDEAGWARVTSFLIQPTIHATSPCLQFIPDTFCVDVPGAPCAPYINMQRFAPLATILGVVEPAPTAPAANPTGYDHAPGFAFSDWPDALFVDPTESVAASKLARSNLVESEVRRFCEEAPPAYYVGNPSQLTLPRKGTLLGVVDGTDPRTGGSIGGISLRLAGKLHRVSQILLTRESDPGRLSPDNIGRGDLLPGADGQVFLVARRDESLGYIRSGEFRGVTTALMVSPHALPLSMHMVIYGDIDEDPIKF